MTEPKSIKEKIAECFKIARQEGEIRRFADGLFDAGDVLNLIIKALEEVENPYYPDVYWKHQFYEEVRKDMIAKLGGKDGR
jgi:hypothetical protein